jgi:putative SOS response-associated peptidase YedK
MCGRYMFRSAPEEVRRAFGVNLEDEFSQTGRELGGERLFGPRYNIAPLQDVPIVRRRRAGRDLTIVREGEGGRELVAARWGLVPGWAKDPSIGDRMINARAETLAEKPAFRAAFRARRCIVPASGFYEWQRRAKGPKQPFLIRRRDGAPVGLAGLWEAWTDPATGEELVTCTIVTCAPNALVAELHDRMPVILDSADYDRWLDPSDLRGAELLRPCPEEWLEAAPVSTRVNSPRNDDESILQPDAAGPGQGTLL